jgi:Caspase domain
VGRKAAVVIGVNRTGILDPLQSAVQAASDVAGWLSGEGFDVALLTDESAPVHSAQVEEALAQFVTVPPRYKLLVVYFSGHGYWHARADRWLLSGAPARGSDAINLRGAMDLARYSGIETVVFFSDACRSIPQTAQEQRIEGVDGFPNLSDFDVPNKVDAFKATSDAQSAYEITLALEPGEPLTCRSVLTTAWLAAYEEASADMVIQVDEDGRKVLAVPNRRLEGFLQRKVDELLAARNDPTLRQDLDVNVPSADDVYVGCVKRPPPPAVRGLANLPKWTPGLEAAYKVERILDTGEVAAAEYLGRDLIPRPAADFPSHCGFFVTGGSLSRVATTREHDARAELLDPGAVQLRDVEPASTVVGQLDDGRCFVVPALSGYIGHITVNASGVANVSYVPSDGTSRYPEYMGRRREIDALRALVAISIDQDTLVVRDHEEAARLARRIRPEKSLDPSLGLYAAHAYSSAGMDEDVADVMSYMLQDLDIALFDVAMLASRRPRPIVRTFPFCPILTQAWNLVRPRGWPLHPGLEELRPALLDSLWTTFAPDAAQMLFDIAEQGVTS